jgi:hypothetical protein
MFMHNRFSTILRMSRGAPGSGSAPTDASGLPRAAPAPAPANEDDDGDLGGHYYTPTKAELHNYRNEIREITENINKQKEKKKKAIKFCVIGAVCSVMLGIGLLMPYGPQGLTALQSLQGAIGGASGLQTAQLAFGFSAAGFAIPIVMTVLSLIFAYNSNRKINELKKERQLNNVLASGVSSQSPDIKHSKTEQIEAALAVVKARSDGLKGLPIKASGGKETHKEI